MNLNRPIESSMLFPKIHRNSMLPPMWSRPPCMNIAVRSVEPCAGRTVAGRSRPELVELAFPFSQTILPPPTSLHEGSPTVRFPGWVSSYGMNAYSTVFLSLTAKPWPFQCACWKPKNIAMLITISATVISGKCRVGMLSLSGSRVGVPRPAWARVCSAW